MQDKEIDQLFRAGLDNLEVEPSPTLWMGIAVQMDAGKTPVRKYLALAASLLILLSTGLYFLLQNNHVVKTGVQNAVVKNNKPAKTVITPGAVLPISVKPQPERAVAVNTISQKPKSNKVMKSGKLPAIPGENVATAQQQPQIAALVLKKADDVKFVLPDNGTPITDKMDLPDDVSFKTNTLLAETDNKIMAAAPVKKQRIRSLGDLINVVVSKVDKRKDKLIEFSSDRDEDESMVSGINLGFIKIKKEEE